MVRRPRQTIQAATMKRKVAATSRRKHGAKRSSRAERLGVIWSMSRPSWRWLDRVRGCRDHSELLALGLLFLHSLRPGKCKTLASILDLRTTCEHPATRLAQSDAPQGTSWGGQP